MKSIHYALSLTLSVLLLNGCGSAENETQTSTINGAVADGYLIGAKVCADYNENGTCDEDEPSVLSGENGSYALSITGDPQTTAILAEINAETIDSDDGQPIGTTYTLSAPHGKHTFISPLTTMIAHQMLRDPLMSREMAEQHLRESLGADAQDVSLYSDYVAQEGALYRRLHRAARIMARIYKQLNHRLADLGIDTTERAGRAWVQNDALLEHLAHLGEMSMQEDGDAGVLAQTLAQEMWQHENSATLGLRIASMHTLRPLMHHRHFEVSTDINDTLLYSWISENGGAYRWHLDYAPSYETQQFMLRLSRYDDSNQDGTVDFASHWYDKDLQEIGTFEDSNTSRYLLKSDGWKLFQSDLTNRLSRAEIIDGELHHTNDADETFIVHSDLLATLEGRRFGALLSRYAKQPIHGSFSQGAQALMLSYTTTADRYIVAPNPFRVDMHFDNALTHRGSAVDADGTVITLDENGSQQVLASLDAFLSAFAYDGNATQTFAPVPRRGGIAFGEEGEAFYFACIANNRWVQSDINGTWERISINEQEMIKVAFDTPLFSRDNVTQHIIYPMIEGNVKAGHMVEANSTKRLPHPVYNEIAFEDMITAMDVNDPF